MAWVFPDNEIDINARITIGTVWVDVDLGTNNDVPAGTKAVIIHMRNTGAASYRGAVRPNGGSINPVGNYSPLTFTYLFVKLDANRIFEAQVRNAALDLRVVAYTNDDIGIDPYVDKTPAVAGSYQDVDVSDAGVPAGAAVALFYLDTPTGLNKKWAIRKDGTTFDSYYYIAGYTQALAFGALSAARLTEVEAEDIATIKTWVQGYIPSSQCLMADTPTEKTPGTAGSWQEVDCSAIIPAGALAAILLIRSGTTWNSRLACVRKKGSTDDFSASSLVVGQRHHHAVVGLDGSRVFQAYVEHATEVDIFVLGYIDTPPAQTISGVGNIATGEALGSPGVLPGPVTLQPVALGTGEAWGTPAVLPGSVSVIASGIVSAEAFGAAAVLPGAVSLQPAGIASEEAVGPPTILPGAVTLQPPGILSGESFGLSFVLPGEVAIRPPGILSAEAFGLPLAARIPKHLETTLTVSRLEVKVDG